MESIGVDPSAIFEMRDSYDTEDSCDLEIIVYGFISVFNEFKDKQTKDSYDNFRQFLDKEL